MPDYDAPVAYRYDIDGTGVVNTYHPKCLIEEMVNRRELSPAARDMKPEDVLNQHAAAAGVEREDGVAIQFEGYHPSVFPESRWPENSLTGVYCAADDRPILELPPLTAVQEVERDLFAAAHDIPRNDFDPVFCERAHDQHGRQASIHVIASNALQSYRERSQIKDWALTGAQGTEALNRPGIPDSIEHLRARLAAPVQIHKGNRLA
jgi:hypothetical protein